jgi:hypothetical protein
MFADPTMQEWLLILVSIHHKLFATTWLPIYKLQAILRVPIMLDKKMFFQIEAEVVKNSKCQDYIDSVVNKKDNVGYQLTVGENVGICLHFPCCNRGDVILSLNLPLYYCGQQRFKSGVQRRLEDTSACDW